MRRRSLLALLSLSPLAAGPAARAQVGVTEPQPKLSVEPLVIVGRDGKRHEFQVEMALSPQQQMTGLMFRQTVGPSEGMLFDWGHDEESTMWMRNTIAPLDMVFIERDGTIRRIAENTVPQSLATIPSQGPVRATLELAAGTAERLDLHPGDKVLQRIFHNAP